MISLWATFTWMVHHGPFPVGFAYVVIARILPDAQYLIIVLSFALLQCQLRLLYQILILFQADPIMLVETTQQRPTQQVIQIPFVLSNLKTFS
jgi:hypothetical protein